MNFAVCLICCSVSLILSICHFLLDDLEAREDDNIHDLHLSPGARYMSPIWQPFLCISTTTSALQIKPARGKQRKKPQVEFRK
ncbi:unnamed protein product [Callosobruchus maculatus]|uniref:Secreted protein n=1 Tax=Callosobruchus maculatus TaxID=64391 RepID=A0A653CTK0_CALMS|nr:unnamed protein product [Callosobruchus maculatus]